MIVFWSSSTAPREGRSVGLSRRPVGGSVGSGPGRSVGSGRRVTVALRSSRVGRSVGRCRSRFFKFTVTHMSHRTLHAQTISPRLPAARPSGEDGRGVEHPGPRCTRVHKTCPRRRHATLISACAVFPPLHGVRLRNQAPWRRCPHHQSARAWSLLEHQESCWCVSRLV